MPITIFAFSPADKVPGFYGQVQYGASGQSAAGQPISLLLVGLETGGTITPDTQVVQVFQTSDLDTFAGKGSELAAMGYDALATQLDIPLFIASPLPPNGAVAAFMQLTIGGSWNVAGVMAVRIAGKTISYNVQATDTPTLVAAGIASAINGYNQGRLPFVAVATGANVLLTCVTPGTRGSQNIVFIVNTGTFAPPSGLTATITGSPWVTAATATLTTYTTPSPANGFYYKVTTVGFGTFGTAQPTWPTTIGTPTTADSNGVVWTCWGQIFTGGGTQPGGGTGLESYTNLLNTLSNQGYGRIALAANDATSIAAWKSAIDTDAGPLIGFLQHAILGFNTTQGPVITQAQTTNDARFQMLFSQNNETHPSRMAASMGAQRAFYEVIDPDKSYDGPLQPGSILPTVAPQSQPPDTPNHAQQVAMLNGGVTPLNTQSGQCFVVRSITTKSQTGGQPDYSVLDTGFAVVPDFVLQYLRTLWITFQQNNSRLVPNPNFAAGDRQPPAGVAYPNLWAAQVQGALTDMQSGLIPGTCPPILYNVAANPPQCTLDPSTSGRLLCAAPVFPTPGLHQLAIAVLEATV